jgi:hypothetical protein
MMTMTMTTDNNRDNTIEEDVYDMTTMMMVTMMMMMVTMITRM